MPMKVVSSSFFFYFSRLCVPFTGHRKKGSKKTATEQDNMEYK